MTASFALATGSLAAAVGCAFAGHPAAFLFGFAAFVWLGIDRVLPLGGKR